MSPYIKMEELLMSLIKTIDIVSFHVNQHHMHVTNIVYMLCQELGWSPKETKTAVFSAALHDIGILSIRERDQLIEMDTLHPHEHAGLGYIMLKDILHLSQVAFIIKHHHEKWQNGTNAMDGDRPIPEASYLIFLADRIDIHIDRDLNILTQVDDILRVFKNFRGDFFKEDHYDAFVKLAVSESFWLDVISIPIEVTLRNVIGDDYTDMSLTELHDAAKLFSRVIDFRSAFTASHSTAVAVLAGRIGQLLNLPEEICKKLEVAGYFHDIGKIIIPSEILNKNGYLDENEFITMKSHAYYSKRILENVQGMEDITQWVSYHHEKLNGQGYPYRIELSQSDIYTKILAVADVLSALTEERPYRHGMYKEDTLITMGAMALEGHLDDELLTVIENHFDELQSLRQQVEEETATDFYAVEKERIRYAIR